MSTTFLAPVSPGNAVVIEGRILQMQAAVAFGEADARLRDSGEVVAKARVTFAIQRRRRST
jgi:acyl-coenzyme A thioesterase PaaI-like protein